MIYTGICEDSKSDPLKLGRIKVRVFGVHTEMRTGEVDHKLLTTADLPWASPVYSSTTQSIDGWSDFGVPEEGSIVLVMFLDKDLQHPVYLGTVPKIANELPDFAVGFSDPNREHPKEDYLKESPISRLARNEKIDKTIIQTKKDQVETGVDCKTVTWDEPETPYATKYPYNRVIETRSGHFIELDDTEGVERIHIYHRSGTNSEIHPDGKFVERVADDRVTIIIGDENILIGGDKNIHINGSRNIHIEQSENILIDGDRDKDVSGDETDDIVGNMKITVSGNTEINTTGQTDINSGGDINIAAGGNVKITGSRIDLN